ncbi:hypothetical protein [Treponema sp.]|uniref:hypothetical protein n=1 Tax=Treponema sp. TaxID=166 RepID=UPI00257BBCB5|nr:hypothetical protein [Treponema sp.]MBE6354858.1 hypothetical protein [Treponema sp.]
MRFYKNQHQFYIGIDLHARTMYICVINNIRETVFHKNMECSRDNLELVTNTFGKDIVVGVECIFTWYWVADFCAERGIDFASVQYKCTSDIFPNEKRSLQKYNSSEVQ